MRRTACIQSEGSSNWGGEGATHEQSQSVGFTTNFGKTRMVSLPDTFQDQSAGTGTQAQDHYPSLCVPVPVCGSAKAKRFPQISSVRIGFHE